MEFCRGTKTTSSGGEMAYFISAITWEIRQSNCPRTDANLGVVSNPSKTPIKNTKGNMSFFIRTLLRPEHKKTENLLCNAPMPGTSAKMPVSILGTSAYRKLLILKQAKCLSQSGPDIA
jgi:hypothetical protein